MRERNNMRTLAELLEEARGFELVYDAVAIVVLAGEKMEFIGVCHADALATLTESVTAGGEPVAFLFVHPHENGAGADIEARAVAEYEDKPQMVECLRHAVRVQKEELLAQGRTSFN